MTYGHIHRRSGFTLVELSVVLVIMGLLVGGVLVGKSMIRSSQMRGILTEYTLYSSAIISFNDKYSGMPGDLRNATKYWGADGGTSATTEGVVAACADLVVPYTSTATCNGNGNNHIAENDSGSGTDDRDQWYEMYRAWQQLSNAGLIEGFYRGGTDRRSWDAQPGYNVPKSRAGDNVGWVVRWHTELDEYATYYFAQSAGHYLYIGTGTEGSSPALTPNEGWNLDTKFDDGKPGLGSIHAFMSSLNANCLTADNVNADYALSNESKSWSLNMRFAP